LALLFTFDCFEHVFLLPLLCPELSLCRRRPCMFQPIILGHS